MNLPKITLKAPLSGFEFDKAKDGWTLVENAACSGNETLELAEFLHAGENYVDGTTMVARAKAMGNPAGQLHAERLLRQQGEIAVEWRDFYLVFPGTTWRRPSGDLYVPYLGWGDGRWYLHWGWLDCRWSRLDRLVRVCK